MGLSAGGGGGGARSNVFVEIERFFSNVLSYLSLVSIYDVRLMLLQKSCPSLRQNFCHSISVTMIRKS